MSTLEATRIPADDGRPLAGTWHPTHAPRGAVIIAPAMATPAVFYRRFATHLAEMGFLVLTFDYRGMERGADVRQVEGDLITWARDGAAALEALTAELKRSGSNAPITCVGHSLGGQILGFVDHSLVDRILVIATSQGYWKHNPPSLRRWILLFWHLIVPASLAAAGYYPGRRIGFLHDLPAGVMRQWRRWCLHPRYWAADFPDIERRHAQIEVSTTAIHLTDDEIVTQIGIDMLLEQLVSAPTELIVLTPADLGSPKVGHHGFFNKSHAQACSDLLLPRLAGRSPASEQDAA